MPSSPRKHLLIQAKAVSLAPSPPAALHNEDTALMCAALLHRHVWGSLIFWGAHALSLFIDFARVVLDLGLPLGRGEDTSFRSSCATDRAAQPRWSAQVGFMWPSRTALGWDVLVVLSCSQQRCAGNRQKYMGSYLFLLACVAEDRSRSGRAVKLLL